MSKSDLPIEHRPPATKLSGGVCFAVTINGDCIVKGFGDVDKEHAESIASKMVLTASRIRNSARLAPPLSMLN